MHIQKINNSWRSSVGLALNTCCYYTLITFGNWVHGGTGEGGGNIVSRNRKLGYRKISLNCQFIHIELHVSYNLIIQLDSIKR